MSDLAGRRLGQYELRGVIRHGGMSTVYKAYQPALQRLVAVKVLAFPGDPEFVARFQREAYAVAALQHPNIVQIYDYGEHDGQVYLVVQYVEDGRTLADLLGRPLAPQRALVVMEQVLAALGHAHERGIVHRDVKPSNVLLASPTWAMLADFGIAKLLLEAAPKLTATNLVVGTAAYMAPEQAFGLPLDQRTDLYAAGVVLYELLTGRVPFAADTPVALLLQHAYQPVPPLRDLNPALPATLEAVLARALAKDPAARYQDAQVMAQAMAEAIRPLQASPSPTPEPKPLPPAARPDPATAAYAAGVQAFAAGQFDLAVAYLAPLAAAAPGYKDVESLLQQARTALDHPNHPAIEADTDSTTTPLMLSGPSAEHAQQPSDHTASRSSGQQRRLGSRRWRLAGSLAAAGAVLVIALLIGNLTGGASPAITTLPTTLASTPGTQSPPTATRRPTTPTTTRPPATGTRPPAAVPPTTAPPTTAPPTTVPPTTVPPTTVPPTTVPPTTVPPTTAPPTTAPPTTVPPTTVPPSSTS